MLMHLAVLSYRLHRLNQDTTQISSKGRVKVSEQDPKTLRGKTISLCSHKGGQVIKSEIHLPHAIVTCRATQCQTAAVPECANGLHYQGHAVTLMSYTHTHTENTRMPNRTKKQKEENSAKICNRKKMDVKKAMCNVVLRITLGALIQTVTPWKSYNAPRLLLHSCRLHC